MASQRDDTLTTILGERYASPGFILSHTIYVLYVANMILYIEELEVTMLERYLQILSESMDKKLDILTQVETLSREQTKLIEGEGSYEDIDANMDAKNELIEQILKMDEGFQAAYDKLKAEIEANKDQYKDQIADIQGKITLVMEKSASIEAVEARNKKAMESRFASAHKDSRQKLNVAAAAQDYYRVNSKLNAITPQFMDTKK